MVYNLFIVCPWVYLGTSSLCKSKVDGDVIGSRPTGCLYSFTYQTKNLFCFLSVCGTISSLFHPPLLVLFSL